MNFKTHSPTVARTFSRNRPFTRVIVIPPRFWLNVNRQLIILLPSSPTVFERFLWIAWVAIKFHLVNFYLVDFIFLRLFNFFFLVSYFSLSNKLYKYNSVIQFIKDILYLYFWNIIYNCIEILRCFWKWKWKFSFLISLFNVMILKNQRKYYLNYWISININ